MFLAPEKREEAQEKQEEDIMENTITKTMVLAAALIATLAVGSAEARHGRGRGHGKRGGVDRALKHVDLTAEQREEIDALEKEMREQAKPIRAKLVELRKKARAQWSAAELDDDAIFATHKQIRALEGKLSDLRLGLRIDTLSVLTPAQRAEIEKAKAERRKMRDGKGKRGSGKKGKKGMKGKKVWDREGLGRGPRGAKAAS
jgi:Spy/CpxP family protein refolding chaperone